jgi:hypothetical protein
MENYFLFLLVDILLRVKNPNPTGVGVGFVFPSGQPLGLDSVKLAPDPTRCHP